MNVTIEPRHEERLHRPWRPEINGWSQDIAPFYAAVAELLPLRGRMLEIGVCEGRSILFLASLLYEIGKPHARLTGLDPTISEVLLKNKASVAPRCDVELIKGWSAESSLAFQGHEFDAVFIDGGHEYDNVCEDILAYQDKVKPGGVLGGHDYGNPEWPGVRRAVDRLLPKAQLFHSVWWVTR